MKNTKTFFGKPIVLSWPKTRFHTNIYSKQKTAKKNRDSQPWRMPPHTNFQILAIFFIKPPENVGKFGWAKKQQKFGF